METNVIPEKERRQKETGFLSHIFETLIGKQSRKVAFGIWLFIVANAFKARTDMPWDVWMKCVMLCTALIGLGTILDDTIAKFGDLIAVFSADKVKTIFTKKTTQETSVGVAEPPAGQ